MWPIERCLATEISLFFSDRLQDFLFVFSTLNVRYQVYICVHACMFVCGLLFISVSVLWAIGSEGWGWSLILSHSWLVFLQIILLFQFLPLFWNSSDTHTRPFDIISQSWLLCSFSPLIPFFFFFALSFRLGDFYWLVFIFAESFLGFMRLFMRL